MLAASNNSKAFQVSYQSIVFIAQELHTSTEFHTRISPKGLDPMAQRNLLRIHDLLQAVVLDLDFKARHAE